MSEILDGGTALIRSSSSAVRVESLLSLSSASLSSNYALLSRKIGSGISIKLPEVSADAHLSIRLQPDNRENWNDSIALISRIGEIELMCGARVLRAITGIDLDDNPKAAGAHWEWLESMILGRLKRSPFCDVTKIDLMPTCQANTIMVQLVIRSNSHAIVTSARADAETWLMFLANTQFEYEQKRWNKYLNLPICIPIKIALHHLPAQVFQEMAVGDVILPGHPYFDCSGMGFIHLAGIRFEVRHRSVYEIEIISKGEKMNSEDESDLALELETNIDQTNKDEDISEHRDSGLNIGALPISLEFELGRVKLRFDELKTIGMGSILEVLDGSPRSIAIRSSGHLLGRGEIVGVDGLLGIRIVHWEQPPC